MERHLVVYGFDHETKRRSLVHFLQYKFGTLRSCRLKISFTPRHYFPVYQADTSKAEIVENPLSSAYLPRAFIVFVHDTSVDKMLQYLKHNQLIFKQKVLKVHTDIPPPAAFYSRGRQIISAPPHIFRDVKLDIGSLIDSDEFLIAWKPPYSMVHFLVDETSGTCKILLCMDITFSVDPDYVGSGTAYLIKCDFKIEVPATTITEISYIKEGSQVVLFMQLCASPLLFYRTSAEDATIDDMLDEHDPYIRTTDFSNNGAFGRSGCLRISVSSGFETELKSAIQSLQRYKVKISEGKRHKQICNEPNFGVPSPFRFFSVSRANIPFSVLYSLTCSVHEGTRNVYQLKDEDFSLDSELSTVEDDENVVNMRRVIITPTRTICLPPKAECSNRILRHYIQDADRFLRISFLDEGMDRINKSALLFNTIKFGKGGKERYFNQKTTIHKRVYRCLKRGIHVCGREYKLLAFSSSQLRENSAWFLAEKDNLTVENVKEWMGAFDAYNVAKHTARIGLCFSSTYATVDVPLQDVLINAPDIMRNGYIFSDGIGTVKPDLALKVAVKLKLEKPPCAYQIRYDGCKGVIACWDTSKHSYPMVIRKSMVKFESNHTMLEVCSWSRFQSAFLNRQIIILLSSLGVKNEVFHKLQATMISKLDEMFFNKDAAVEVSMTSKNKQGNMIAEMLAAGFLPESEPHLASLMYALRTVKLRALRDKARIYVEDGRYLVGCLDEDALLNEGQCFIQISSPGLQSEQSFRVIQGRVVVTKNPCLHPGDIRVLNAVDVSLHHMSDCIVFPQRGERPHPNEIAGSDLDGDTYFVSWNEDLIPEKTCEPMIYDVHKSKVEKLSIKEEDIIRYFVDSMVTDDLGKICNAHMVHADLSDLGANDVKCLELAELASKAVDAPKTGLSISMPRRLKPMEYPDFMGKPLYKSYQSKKILGQLFRKVKQEYIEKSSTFSDVRCSAATEVIGIGDGELYVEGSANFIKDAVEQKCVYDNEVFDLMAKYQLSKEEELVTGYVQYKSNKQKQGDMKEQMKREYISLQEKFRGIFENLDPEMEQLNEVEKKGLLEQKASAWYQVTYFSGYWKNRDYIWEKKEPLLSFAWIALDHLADIKSKARTLEI